MYLNIFLKYMVIALMGGLFFFSPLLATYHEEDRQEQTLREAIHQGLGLKEDMAMNAYVLLTQKMETGQIKDEILLDLRDRIKAPEALIDGKISARPKTQHLEGLIHCLEKSTEALEDQELASVLQSLKEHYQAYLQKIQSTKGDELNHCRQLKERVSIEGDSNFYRIHALMDMDLLDLQHHHNAAHAYEQHEGVFYKAHEGSNKPLAPGQEYAVYALYRLLNIDIPATLLLSVDSDENYVKRHWPHRMIQASYVVKGESFQMILEQIAQEKLSEQREAHPIANYSQQFIGALLSIPQDGKANNYIYNTETQLLTPIDNDLSFGSLISQGDHPYLMHRNILFCLEENLNQPFDQEYATFLKKQDPAILLLTWLGQLQQKNEAYRHLFTLNHSLERFEDLRLWDHQESKRDYLKRCEQRRELLEHQRRYFVEEDYKELGLPLQLSWHQVKSLYDHMIKLQQGIRNNQFITHTQLLEQCVPLSAALYHHIHKQKLSPLDAYELVKTTDLMDITEHNVQNQMIKHWLQQEKEASQEEDNLKLLSSDALAEKFLSTYYSVASLEGAPSLAILEMSYRYFPALIYRLFKQGLPQGYLEQLIRKQISYPLLKALLQIQEPKAKLNVRLLNTAFNVDHHEAVRALVEEDLHTFTTDPAYRYWQRLIINPQGEALTTFEKLIPYAPELEWKLDLEKLFPTKVEIEVQEGKKEENFIESLYIIKGNYLKHRSLSPDQIQWLFNVHGHFIKRNKVGRSDVSWWPQKNPQVYFKKRPEIPGYEYAATSFMRRLGITDVPYSELMAFYNAQEGHYPVLVTQAVQGDLIKDIWGDDTVFHHLDPDHTQLMILAAMLINVEDGKEDNYILSPDHQKLVAIDNDHAFMPGSIQFKEKGFLRTTVSDKLQAKSLLFCLQEMNKPFTEKVRKQIQGLEVEIFLNEWLNELVKVNDRYQGFFSNAGQFFHHSSPTILRIPLSSTFMEGLYHKFYTLKELMSNPTINPLHVLLHVEPYVGKQYVRAFEDIKNKTVKDRFSKVTEGLYQKNQNGDRLSIVNSREMMEIIHIPDQELIGEAYKVTTGPLAALEVLESLQEEMKAIQGTRTQLLNGSSSSSLSTKGSLTLDLKGKSSREQSQFLPKVLQNETPLQILSLYNSTALSDAYLKPLPVQEKLALLRCLDLRGCTSLTDNSFQLIYTASPLLEYLNVSGCSKLKLLESQKEHYSLRRLVAQNCSSLRSINLILPALVVLEASHNSVLKVLKVKSKILDYVDVEGCRLLEWKEVEPLVEENILFKQIKFGDFQADLFDLGLKYVEGIGVEQDIQRALKYYLLAVNQKHPKVTPLNQEVIEQYIRLLEQRLLKADFIKNILFSPEHRSLSFYDKNVGLQEVYLISYGNLPYLTELELRWNKIGAEGVKFITESQTLKNLTSLILGRNNIGDEGARFIAESEALLTLTELERGNNKIGAEGIRFITESQTLKNLTSLNLRDTYIGAEVARFIAESETLRNLTSLNLGYNRIGPEGVRFIAESQMLTSLTELDVGWNNIGVEGTRFIAESQTLRDLKTLNLRYNEIWAVGVKAIASSPTLRNLMSLNLENNMIWHEGAEAIASSPTLRNLTSLNLRDTNIGVEGARFIAESDMLRNLTSLNLEGNNIGAEGAKAIAESPTLSGLTSLNLGWNNIGAEGKKALRESPYLKNTKIEF